MPSWSTFEDAAPELAADVRRHFDAFTHKFLATLRKDGSPRICGSECRLVDGELYIGSMLHALKARDLQRDPRYALHSGSASPPGFTGDAKVAGVAEELTDPAAIERIIGREVGPSHLFRLDIAEASVTRVAGGTFSVTVWTPAGVRRLQR